MGQKSPAKSFCRQANLIIGFLTCLFACLIVGRVIKDVIIATPPRLFFAWPPVETERGDVMRAALPFGSVCCPRQEQRSDTGYPTSSLSGRYQSSPLSCAFFNWCRTFSPCALRSAKYSSNFPFR